MDLRSVDLNLLVTLDVLLEECHVTRAASRLAMSQPATTAQLQRLRRLFEDELLVRDGRTLRRTPLADSLIEPVKDALVTVEAALAVQPEFDPATSTRTFSILASDYVAVVFLRPLIAMLDTAAPHVRIRVLPLVGEWRTELRHSHTDFLVMPERLIADHYRDFPKRALFTDRYVCAVCKSHPSVKRTISLEELATLPHVQYRAGDRLALADIALADAGIDVDVEAITETMISVPYLLADTRAVGFVLERLAKRVAPSAGIRLLESPVEIPEVQESIVWHPRLDPDPAHRWLREQILALATTL